MAAAEEAVADLAALQAAAQQEELRLLEQLRAAQGEAGGLRGEAEAARAEAEAARQGSREVLAGMAEKADRLAHLEGAPPAPPDAWRSRDGGRGGVSFVTAEGWGRRGMWRHDCRGTRAAPQLVPKTVRASCPSLSARAAAGKRFGGAGVMRLPWQLRSPSSGADARR